ncbi:MAG: pyruvate, phosphate dikinase [Oscillospiraceae bacterium]|nr:pyruvate, phosphate dikinase [Oscillospiraceae bacterium]
MGNAYKYVYLFSEGNGAMKELLGGKGANLAEMTNLGMPVPQGFTITTEACTRYYSDGKTISPDIQEQIFTYLAQLERITGKKFGDPENPLLISVRSGARASMPGMMDTILNLGLNDTVVEGFARMTGNPRFAYDSYRRFIQMFSDVVMELPKKRFEEIIDAKKAEKGVTEDTALDTEDLKDLVARFKAFYLVEQGGAFPSDPNVQLMEAVKAVFRSWDNPRANVYRRINEIPYDWGTAVNVQSMVFGNSGENSGTGVAFTRNPATGEKALFGEYLMNAQGEDVVAGVRTPWPISRLAQEMPAVYAQFADIANRLEAHYKDMQDMEFTIENGTLYMLQTRNGKRTTAAALKIAVDLVDEWMITEQEAVLRVDPKQLDSLLHPQFDRDALAAAVVLGSGLAASPGAACGKVVFTAEEARQWHERGEKVILVRLETSPEDIEGMQVAQGILTVRGGMTSHAAVVARGMGTCCVSGCGEIVVDYDKKQFTLGGKTFHEGDTISLDGSTGHIYGEAIATVPADVTGGAFGRLMSWADQCRRLQVYANADTPRDAVQSRQFGAEGIGLCRTEHMFFDEQRIKAMREMIVADSTALRKRALDKIMPYQQADFEGLYEAMEGCPVVIRFLDPPLHEFLPTKPEDIAEIAADMGLSCEKLQSIIEGLHEFNPMMGHRGCRLSVTYPEIAEMQTTAVIRAAIAVTKRGKYKIEPQIMIPLVGDVKEMRCVKEIVVKTADVLIAEAGIRLPYQVGAMIEIPRAALTADEIASEAEFFSFGTNDLTQMTFGFSRDDAGKFLDSYYSAKIYESDPFAHLDQKGVGKLVSTAVELGRRARPSLHLGICGEHGGDPTSVEFFHRIGLDYVSCSPYRVPIARLAAAQAAINFPKTAG